MALRKNFPTEKYGIFVHRTPERKVCMFSERNRNFRNSIRLRHSDRWMYSIVMRTKMAFPLGFFRAHSPYFKDVALIATTARLLHDNRRYAEDILLRNSNSQRKLYIILFKKKNHPYRKHKSANIFIFFCWNEKWLNNTKKNYQNDFIAYPAAEQSILAV